MPEISKEENLRQALEFVEAHKESYTPRELAFIKANIVRNIGKEYISDVLRQIYDEFNIIDQEKNMYATFLRLLEENFDINRDIIEVGGGIIPALAKRLALHQKSGTITVYDPRLITTIEHPANLILKKQMFSQDTPIENTAMIIGFMPCDATNLLIDVACQNNVDFMIALCEGGMRRGYEWLEDDEWVEYIKYTTARKVEGQNMGTLETISLSAYHNPYPIIYNKRRKS